MEAGSASTTKHTRLSHIGDVAMTTKLISREPTEEMLRAALDSDSGFKLSTPLEELYVNIFKAMFDAVRRE